MKKVFLGLLMTGALFSCTSEKGYKIIGSVPKDMDSYFHQVDNFPFHI